MNIIKLIINIIFEIFCYIFKYKNYDDFIISLVRRIAEYNIIFIKIFQWIWINNNKQYNHYITPKIENELCSYTNNTPFDDDDFDYKSLLNVFLIAEKNSDVFKLDSLEPINSGTISLVFKGKLNNKDIVIKILRKNIKDKIENGINFLIKLENIIYYIPFVNYYVSTKIFEKNKSYIYNQINFINESENLSLFYKKFKNNKIIKIPMPYNHYTMSNNNVILMDYINGKYLNELNVNELDNFFMPFCKFIVSCIFYKKYIHCDLHQGNILFFTEMINDKIIYKVGILDFGMVTKLNINEIDFMYMLFNGVFNNKFKEFIDFIKNSTNLPNIFDYYDKVNDCMETLEKLFNDKKLFYEINKTNVFIDNIYTFLNILKKYNCKLSSRYNFFVLSLIPVFSILIKLGPEIKKRNVIKDYIEKISSNDLLD